MKVIVYTQANCVWCVKAKKLLGAKNIPFTEIIVGSPECSFEDLKKAFFPYAVRTVPQIVMDGMRIGGYEDLVKHLEEANA